MDADNLRNLAIFDGLSDSELERCASMFQETEILAGSGLSREGDFAYKFFIVLDGEVEVLRDFEHIANLVAGDYFGEMGLVTGERRNARVIATTRCKVAWLMPWDFQTMTEEMPGVASHIEATIAERTGEIETD